MYIKIYFFFKLIITNKFAIRNSPTDYIGTFVKLLSAGIRTGGSAAFGTGLSLSLASEMDDILKKEGRNPIFIPKLKEIFIKNPRLNEALDHTLNKLGATKIIKTEVSIENNTEVAEPTPPQPDTTARKSLDNPLEVQKTVQELNEAGVPITQNEVEIAKTHFYGLSEPQKIEFMEEINKKALNNEISSSNNSSSVFENNLSSSSSNKSKILSSINKDAFKK